MDKVSKINILHLEDSAKDSQLIQLALKKAELSFEYYFADNEEDFIFNLSHNPVDIILSDYHLPGYSGTEALLFVKNNYPNIRFVFVSGTMGEEAAINSLLNGATDYVLKNKLERLGPAVRRAYKESQEQIARQKAEQALYQSEENFHRSIAESPLGIRIVSVDGRTIYANKAFLDIYEFNNLEEFINTPAKVRYTPESFKDHELRKGKRKSGMDIPDYELSIISKNGEIRHIKVSRTEILWNGIKHYQVINQDITEQKKLTAALITAKEIAEQNDRLKTAFLHNISHEIRTPMNAIVGFSSFLNDPDLLPEKRSHYIDIIIQSCDQLLSIISDIVSIATIEAGQEKIFETEINLNTTLKLLYEQFRLKAKEQNLCLSPRLFLPDGDDRILTDETKLIQILTNLIGNALKFTKTGFVQFGYTVKQGELEFFVEDTGIGIPQEMHEEIFQRFRQVESTMARQFGGSGLGLSISKAYVELLGGKLWLTSELNQGSVFYFTLPLKRIKKPPFSTANEIGNPSFLINGTLTILIAEDEESNYLLLQEIFSGFNFKLIRAMNGKEAVSICQSQPVDLVLMDIKMPVMDGYTATVKIRELFPDLPIIAQTAYTTESDRNKAFLCGCNDIISKPIKQEILISKLEKNLKK